MRKKTILQFNEFHSFESRDGKEVILESVDSTKFELDLVKAFNEKSKSPTAKAAAAKAKYQSKEAETGAKACVLALTNQMGEVDYAYKLSGGSANKKTPVLAEPYYKFGEGKSVKSQEPKTDIVLKASGKQYFCSVKEKSAAQLASAQTNEIYAVMNAAFSGTKGEKIVNVITEIISELGNKEVYEKTRAAYRKKYGNDGYDAAISKVLGLKTGASKPTKEEMQMMNEFLQMMGVKERITSAMFNFMSAPENRMRLFEEFALGKRRFNDKRYIPSHFLAWSLKGDANIMTAQEFLKKKFNCFKFGLRARGKGRGQSGRLDLGGACSESYSHMNQLIIEQMIDEQVRIEQYNYIYESIMSKVGDWAKRTTDTMKKTGMAVYAAGKEWLNKFVELVKRFASFVAKLMSYGFSLFMSFFGVSVDTMEFQW
jgi:hypothetical protein